MYTRLKHSVNPGVHFTYQTADSVSQDELKAGGTKEAQNFQDCRLLLFQGREKLGFRNLFRNQLCLVLACFQEMFRQQEHCPTLTY